MVDFLVFLLSFILFNSSDYCTLEVSQQTGVMECDWVPKQLTASPSISRNACCYFLSLLFILRIIYLVTDFNNLDSSFPYEMRQGKRPVSSLGAVSVSTSWHRPPWRHHCDISPSFPTRRHSNETGDLTSLCRWHCDSRDGIHPNEQSAGRGSVWTLVLLTIILTSYTDILMDEKHKTW